MAVTAASRESDGQAMCGDGHMRREFPTLESLEMFPGAGTCHPGRTTSSVALRDRGLKGVSAVHE